MTDAKSTLSPQSRAGFAVAGELTWAAAQFVNGVLALRPGIAVFDCDGTLWAGDSGEQFLYWELKRRLLPAPAADWIQPRYREYKAGRVSEEDICGEMVAIHEGLTEEELCRAADEFFAEMFTLAVFPDMLRLTQGLRAAGSELWAVSSTNEWVVRAGARRFGIPNEHVIAACVYGEQGIATGRLKRVPTGPDKAVAIREIIPGNVDVAFGNSIHDADMLALAPRAFAINPNPDLRQIADQRGWPIYFPMGTSAHKPDRQS